MSSRKNKGFYLHEWVRTMQDMIFYAIVIVSVACCFPSPTTVSANESGENSKGELLISDDSVSADEIEPVIETQTEKVKRTGTGSENETTETPSVIIIDSYASCIDIAKIAKEENDKQVAEAERLAELERQKAIRAAFCYETNKSSNIPPEMLKEVIRIALSEKGYTDSKMYGIENAVLEAENYASMNALDILSIMSLESAYGTSYSARVRNNLVGATGKNGLIYYDSVGSGVNHFGKFMGDYYISQGRTTLNTIAPKYCPPRSSYWASDVQTIKGRYIEILNTL